MSTVAHWLRDNPTLMLVIGQIVVGVIYFVNLEARVSTLEVRGSPHLQEINTRLTVLEGATKQNAHSIERITEIMTRELHINPTKP